MQPETGNDVRAAADLARKGDKSTREAARDQLASIIAEERKLIEEANAARQGDMRGHWLGLALSGGGIRSASFALGILQALHNWNLFRRIDYLSTVSGGGYIGSALTYFLQAKGMGARGEFPFGKRAHSGARSISVAPPLRTDTVKAARGEETEAPPPDADAIISYLRLHAHYLTPAPDLGWPAFIGSAIRAAFTALAVYFPLLLAGTTLLAWSEYALGQLKPVQDFLATLSCWGNALVVTESSGAFCGPGLSEVDQVIFVNWPLLGLLLVLACSIVNALAFVARTDGAIKSQDKREGVYPGVTIDNARWNGHLLQAFVLFVILSLLPWLAHLLHAGVHTVVTASVSTLVGYLGTLWDFRSRLKGATGKGSLLATVRPILFAALTAYGLLVLAMSWSEMIVAWNGPYTPLWVGLAAAAVFIGFSLALNAFSNLNLISQHRMYRDRLMEAFCPSDRALARMSWRPSVYADTLPLSQCTPQKGAPLPGPYHLINTALVAPNAKSTLYRSRGGDNFVLSPIACGSDATGWSPTTQFLNGMLTLPTAMAISGAALNAHSGAGESAPTRNGILSFLLTLFGAQLGYWAPHPLADDEAQKRQPKFLNPGGHGLTGCGLDADKSRGFVQLADGGHFENLALYELVRRRTDVIICSDAAQDQDYGFEDLGIAVERLRVDHGTNIEFRFPDHGPAHLLPGSMSPASLWAERYAMATRGFAIAEILYPATDTEPKKSGYLLYFKSTLIEGLPSDLYAYKKLNPDFPNQTTVDQDFDEYQFEAYRELGYRLATECFLELFPDRRGSDVPLTMAALWAKLDQISNPPPAAVPLPEEPPQT